LAPKRLHAPPDASLTASTRPLRQHFRRRSLSAALCRIHRGENTPRRRAGRWVRRSATSRNPAIASSNRASIGASFQCRALSRVWTWRCEAAITALRAAGSVMIGRLGGPSDGPLRRRERGRLGRLGGGVPSPPSYPAEASPSQHAVFGADTLNRIAVAVKAVLTKLATVSPVP
jgi:hypothetical protein